jgi:hypothetical protein
MGRPRVMRFDYDVARVGWHGVGERANRRGPCISEGRERRRDGWMAPIK